MSDIRQMSEEYAKIAAKVMAENIELRYILDSDASIVYLTSKAEKTSNGRIVHAQCEKVPDKYKWGVPADFTITVFEPNVAKFSDEQKEILIYHELLHVGIEKNGSKEKYYCKPHDLEDFKQVISKYGTDWSETYFTQFTFSVC